MLHELEDPRVADALVDYMATNPKPHWKTEAALRLAEVGDVRAVPTLAWRMGQDPLKLYNDVDDPELRRDDNERVVAARMLADLAILHPDQTADDARAGRGAGHVAGSPTSRSRTRTASASSPPPARRRSCRSSSRGPIPKGKFPEPGAQPPIPSQWETAQSALRYLGWTKDPRGWPIFEKQLNRISNKKYDVTMQGLMQGGLAIVGMTIRAMGVGAADGVRAVRRPEGVPDPREVHRGQGEQRAGAHRGVLRALLGGDGRRDEGRREEGSRLQQARSGQLPHPRLLPRRRSSTGRCPTRPPGSSIS